MLRSSKLWFITVTSIVIYLVSSVSFSTASSKEFNETFATEIDEFVLREMTAGNIPGLAIGIVSGDEVIFLKGYGTAGPGKGDVTPKTAFVLGSVSKSFTGLAILKLSEKGLLNLNDPVKKYIPWFSIGGPLTSGNIKIMHLLNHTSGIPAYYGNDSGVELGDTLEERIKLKNNIQLESVPGSTFEYSSLNYDILGLLIEVVSGESYEKYIQSNIFDPLEMKNSYVSLKEASKGSLATGYRPWFGLNVPTEIEYSMSALPSGYIASSAKDMTQYLMAFINGGRYGRSKVFTESLITEAQTSISNTSYSAGWFSAGYYKWHTGEVANYNAYICTVPSESLGIVVLSNTNDIGIKFLNRGCSSLTRIQNGIRVKLMGGQLPDKTRLDTKAMYSIVNITIILLFVLTIKIFIWPLRAQTGKNTLIFWLGLRAVVSLTISSVLLYAVPVYIKGSWQALLISVPDLTLSALILAVLLIIAVIINTVKFIVTMVGRKLHLPNPYQKI